MRTRQFGCGILCKGVWKEPSERKKWLRVARIASVANKKGKKPEERASLTRTGRSARLTVSLMLLEAEGQLRERKKYLCRKNRCDANTAVMDAESFILFEGVQNMSQGNIEKRRSLQELPA
jgi:hypothetical protein